MFASLLLPTRRPSLPNLRSGVRAGAFAALTGLSLLIAPSAFAQQVAVTYTVAGVGPFAYFSDTASLTGVTGQTATLVSGVPQTLNIGNLVFNLGDSGTNTGTQVFNSNRTITVNGISSTLTQNTSIFVGTQYDEASVSGGNVTTFDLGSGNFVDVTPVASNLRTVNFGANTAPITATFVLRSNASAAAPEPGTLPLVGMGLTTGIAAVGTVRRRKAKAKQSA